MNMQGPHNSVTRGIARIVFGTAAVYALGWIVIASTQHWQPTSVDIREPLILAIIGVVVLFLLQIPQWRDYWPEAWIIGLMFFASAIWIAPVPAVPSAPVLALGTAPSNRFPSVNTRDAFFTLPASKIQSDLRVLNPDSKIVVILVLEDDGEETGTTIEQLGRYDARLHDILDIDDIPLAAPYRLAANVRISIERGLEDARTAKFAQQLRDTSAIYILPGR